MRRVAGIRARVYVEGAVVVDVEDSPCAGDGLPMGAGEGDLGGDGLVHIAGFFEQAIEEGGGRCLVKLGPIGGSDV